VGRRKLPWSGLAQANSTGYSDSTSSSAISVTYVVMDSPKNERG